MIGTDFTNLYFCVCYLGISAADVVIAKILQHPIYKRAKRLSVYISMPTSELRTDAIIQDALSQSTSTAYVSLGMAELR